jgi:hypothetical protein
MVLDAEQENRARAEASIEFSVGEQWPAEIKAAREKDKLPMLTLNLCDVLIWRVAGSIMANIPQLKTIPAESGDLEAALSIHKIIGSIERNSNAENIYKNVAVAALDGGFGYYRIMTQFPDDDTFEREIVMKYIKNRFTVRIDPDAELDNREDMDWAFIEETMKLEDFKRKYPKITPSYHFGESDEGTALEKWYYDSKIVVAEYYWKKPKTKTLLLVQDIGGKELTIEEGEHTRAQLEENGIKIIEEREVKSHDVMWVKTIGKKILEGPRKIPCKYIPIVKVIGKEKVVKGKTQLYSLIEQVKSSQRLLNYAITTQAIMVSKQPKAVWLSERSLIERNLKDFKRSSKEDVGVLIFDRDPEHPQDRPERILPPVSSQGYMDLINFSNNKIEETSGINEATLGKRSNEVSGKAIQARMLGSEIVTSVFSDNLIKGILHGGRILIDMIGRVYTDLDKVIRILGEDDTISYLKVNTIVRDADDPEKFEVENDISKGKYDYVIDASTSYKTRRRENIANYTLMLQLLVNHPVAQTVVASQIVRNMDVDNANEVAALIMSSLQQGGQGSSPNIEGNQTPTDSAVARRTALEPG